MRFNFVDLRDYEIFLNNEIVPLYGMSTFFSSVPFSAPSLLEIKLYRNFSPSVYIGYSGLFLSRSIGLVMLDDHVQLEQSTLI